MDHKYSFQLKTDQILQNIERQTQLRGVVPKLLLHSCCAPCSSYVLEYLGNYLSITIFYYNPNISVLEEYQKRVGEQKRLIRELPVKNQVSFMEGGYDKNEFLAAVKGLEHLGERSARCYACYRLRLTRAAQIAKEQGFDYFTTTLSISPYKNANWLNEIGEELQQVYGVSYLYADFKKRNGYKRSIELSEQYHLYRQDYCGCAFSQEEEAARRQRSEESRM